MLKPCITEEKGGRDNVKEIRREGEIERGYVKKRSVWARLMFN